MYFFNLLVRFPNIHNSKGWAKTSEELGTQISSAGGGSSSACALSAASQAHWQEAAQNAARPAPMGVPGGSLTHRATPSGLKLCFLFLSML